MQQILLSTDHHITVGWSVDEERPQPFKILICALWIIFTSLLFYVCFIHICPTFPSPSDIFLHHKIAFPFDGASFLTKSLVVFLPFFFFLSFLHPWGLPYWCDSLFSTYYPPSSSSSPTYLNKFYSISRRLIGRKDCGKERGGGADLSWFPLNHISEIIPWNSANGISITWSFDLHIH
jgi:hypothetical protein